LIKKKYKYKIIILTKYKDLFLHNPYIWKTYKIDDSSFYSKILFYLFQKIKFDFIKEFSSNIKDTHKKIGLKSFPNLHLAEYHARGLNLNLDFRNFKPIVIFSKNEKKIFRKKFSLPKDFILIQSKGKTSFTRNKEWSVNNFQKVVNSNTNLKWIQLRYSKDKEDFPLKNIFNLYNDLPIRELFYIISKSKSVFCLEGFVNHVSAAFEKKTFLLLSGYLSKKNVTYKNNIVIHNLNNLTCAPCYKIYDCDIKNKPCTNNIKPEQVNRKINYYL